MTAPTPAAPDDPLDPAEWPIGRLLATAGRLLQVAFDTDLTAVGLNHAGFIALHVLAAGPLSQAELAHRCRVTAQTMSRTLDRLDRLDYVSRHRDPHDSRRRHPEPPAGLDPRAGLDGRPEADSRTGSAGRTEPASRPGPQVRDEP